jgi:hypothetical protein
MFCFQGINSKLVKVGLNGTATEYRAETDNGAFLRFLYYNPTGLNPYWQVTDKSGNNFYFGESTASRMTNPKWTSNYGTSTFRWALNRSVDVNSNKTVFTYTTDTNQLYLTQIQYNLSDRNGSLPANTLDFILTNRSDVAVSFLSGYRVTTQKLLKEIQVKANGQQVRKYSLNYTNSPSTYRCLISAVTQYGSDFTTALPALTFSYQVQPFQFSSTNDCMNLTGAADTLATSSGWVSVSAQDVNTDSYLELVDMDNDGFPDRYLRSWVQEWDAETHQFVYTLNHYVARNTSTNFASTLRDWSPVYTVNIGGSQPSSPRGGSAITEVDLLDLNADGLPDRVVKDGPSPPDQYWSVQTNVSPGVYSTQFAFSPLTNETTAFPWLYIRASDTGAAPIHM